MKVLMLHGVNHDMFGKRDPKQYGTVTLAEIDGKLKSLGKELGAEVESYQTNHEGAMCERIHQAYREGKDAPKMMSVGMHCRLLGRPGRLRALQKFLDHVEKHDRVWVCRRIDIARHWKQRHPFR